MIFAKKMKMNIYALIVRDLYVKSALIIISLIKYMKINLGDWGLGIGDWGLGIGDWAQSPIPNPQSPCIDNKISKKINIIK